MREHVTLVNDQGWTLTVTVTENQTENGFKSCKDVAEETVNDDSSEHHKYGPWVYRSAIRAS